MIARAIYEMTPTLLDWLTHRFESFEKSTFVHYRESMQLVNIVQAAEEGRVPKFAALSAIRQFNEVNGTDLSYESISMLDTTHIFSDCGEWVVFTDNSREIICGPHDDAETACSDTPDHVEYVLVWDTTEGDLVVYKSPHTGRREGHSDKYALGMVKGDRLSFVLPPEVEASMYENL